MASATRTPQRMFTVYDYSNDEDFFQETAAHHAVSAHDVYLAHLHGRERILMAIRRHLGAARSVDRDRNLGECRLEDHRVCYDAAIRAKPCELYRLRPETAHGLRKRQRTKRRLLDDSCRPRDIRCQSRCDFPALRCPDTMYHRQKLTFLRLQIGRIMRVLRENQRCLALTCQLRQQARLQCWRTLLLVSGGADH